MSGIKQKEILGNVLSLLELDSSLDTIGEVFDYLSEIPEDTRDYLTTKLLAEIAFLIGLKHKERGEFEESEKFANVSIKLYKECNISNLGEAVPILVSLLPEYMHEGVVKTRLEGN